MQPWEREKNAKVLKNKKAKRTIRKKIGLVTNALTISVVACTFIYGSVMYEFTKEVIFKIDPKLKR